MKKHAKMSFKTVINAINSNTSYSCTLVGVWTSNLISTVVDSMTGGGCKKVWTSNLISTVVD